MRLGILTHPIRLNCGGILQNYALSTILRQMGHEVQTIDRHLDKNGLYVFVSWLSRLIRYYVMHKNVSIQYNMMHTRKSYLKNALYEDFINSYIPRTQYISSNKKLSIVNKWGFDAIVVGSDQIWLRMYIPTSFLSFLKDENVRRVSYAASFGKEKLDYSPTELKQCSSLAKKFYAISVREKSAVGICKEQLGVTATHVLDPTMLLSLDDYNKLCSKIPVNSNRFLFVYILDKTPWKQNLINLISSKQNMEIVDYSQIYDKSIELWLSLFRDSSFVLTDSFHGTAFSIIYKKQFLTIDNSVRGNTRFQSLFEDVALTDRLIHENSELGVDIKVGDVDYRIVNERLTRRIDESKSFLKEALS